MTDSYALDLSAKPLDLLDKTFNALTHLVCSDQGREIEDAVRSELKNVAIFYMMVRSARMKKTEVQPKPVKSSDGQKDCFYWRKNGRCNNGENCRFQHDEKHKVEKISHTAVVSDNNEKAQCFMAMTTDQQPKCLEMSASKFKKPRKIKNGKVIQKTHGKKWQNFGKNRMRRLEGQPGHRCQNAPPGLFYLPSAPFLDSSAGRGVPPTHNAPAKKKAADSKRKDVFKYRRREPNARKKFYATPVPPACFMPNACPSPFLQYKARAATGHYIHYCTDNSHYY